MADKPETLEETQARLARVPQGVTPQPSPAVSSPITSVPPPPGTPYGPTAPGAPDVSHLSGAGDFGTSQTRPDPYATAAFAQPGSAVPLAPTPSRRPFAIAAIAFGAVAVVVIAAVVAYFALAYTDTDIDPSGGDPLTGGEPEYSEEWQSFPGVSWSDPSVALEQPSYEEVSAQLDAMAAQFRDELTAEFGIVWSERYGTYSGLESNGYGGDSMLYYYDSGSWQGQVRLNDPGARQRILDIFTAISDANGGEGVFLRNEIYSDDPDASRSDFGAEKLEDQALWSFIDWFPSIADAALSADVIDRSIPVDSSFDGDYMFTFDESSDTLYVSFYAYAGALLKEADREAFEDALAPYNGDYEP